MPNFGTSVGRAVQPRAQSLFGVPLYFCGKRDTTHVEGHNFDKALNRLKAHRPFARSGLWGFWTERKLPPFPNSLWSKENGPEMTLWFSNVGPLLVMAQKPTRPFWATETSRFVLLLFVEMLGFPS